MSDFSKKDVKGIGVAKRALITGVSGQDAAYLARHLLGMDYELTGSSRDTELPVYQNLTRLGIVQDIELVSMNLEDPASVASILKTKSYDEIYHLACQSSVGLSFEQPIGTINSGVMGTLNLLEAVRTFQPAAKFYNASSSECFGESQMPSDSGSSLVPRSPYGIAKTAASHLARIYREAYSLFAVSGFMFNHESPLRGKRFVTTKIIDAAYKAAIGVDKKLVLSNTHVFRDWGWAPEYVQAMHQMLQQSQPLDVAIGTGKSSSLLDFVKYAYAYFELNYLDYLVVDERVLRPNEIRCNFCNVEEARLKIGWSANYNLPDVVNALCEAKANGTYG